MLFRSCSYARPPGARPTGVLLLVPANAATSRSIAALRVAVEIQDDGTLRIPHDYGQGDDPKAPVYYYDEFGLKTVYQVGRIADGTPLLNAISVDEGVSGASATRIGFVVGTHLTVFDSVSKKLLFENDLPELQGREQYEFELTQTAAVVNIVDWTKNVTRVSTLYGFDGASYQIPISGYCTFSRSALTFD